ncbi:cation-transporting P-type ATPase [Coprococcus eutactus]|jgi:calcium-translocating P-type ATPase|uniref:cation-translocating P-type ATPase n=1 Tax=Coprococcus eutactus TaxID=33043 RepID=UPI00156FE270|nr:cation-transporting P-type ATPase [Coprococcus eutactus]MCB5503423.1 cation-transporting P-type ATPase [Coprococcus eutactus]NSC95245.1 cation-transporting P-type ATPase [Coprococcus eutactus]NSD34317.1 cation-transporting P-type ATPase [Coprococcus eutactus]
MNGLSSKEVLKSRELHGSNKLPEPKLDKWYDFAKEALSEKITMILIAIAVLQLFLGVMGVMDLSDPIMILVVLAIVTCIAVKTGLGVQKSAAELRAKTSVRYCDVIRDGKVQTINKDELVVGDLVCIGMGQEIFADGYLIEGKISVNNAAINGETKECKKTPVEGYVHKKTTSTDAYTNQNCLFAGTTVMSGEGKMIVTDVGVNTVNGDTLVKMQTLEAPKTALDIALDNLSDFISKWGTIAAVITFAVLTISGIAQVGFGEYFSGGVLNIIQKIAQNFSVALTIIVAAVPEGLPLIVKLVTKQNVKTMEKFNILAKNPGKIPELAYVDIICTDKTGTLTTGIMTPKKIIDGFGNDVNKDSVLWNNIKANISLNNSATFDSENNITGGNSIDRAVLSLVNPETYADIQKKYPVKLKQVFNSSNKYSAFTTKDGVTYYKGAPEKLIEHCTKVMDSSGEIIENNDNDTLSNAITAMTSNAMRCIAVTMADGDLVENEIPNDMTFLGIIGVVDPVRDEVPSAVKTAHKAGIQVVEITGDCIETAVAVATECGIYKDGDLALTNDEFEAMSDDEVKSIIPRLRVISRCSPNTKLRLVTLAQEIGKSVAMTGDGVNDSPALKRADVGFGMQGGSDVAKEASDIVLTDDNFASVVKAVELGRTFMHNIMMFLEFQLPINISLLILSVIYPMIATGALLASVQILIVNIIMDSLNSLSFGGEPPKDEYMTEKPIKKGSGLFIRGAKKRIALSTVAFIALYGIITFSPIANMFASETEAMTARFALLCFMAVFNGFNIRTEHINLFNGIGKNKLFSAIAIGIFVMTFALCNFAENLIKVTALDFKHWVVVVILAFMVIPIDLIRKIIKKKRENK